MLVIDASAALAMVFDEREHDDQVFDSLAEQQLIVPAHWHAEIGNALTTGVRRGRLNDAQLGYALANLKVLRVLTEALPEGEDIAAGVRRAVASGLTYYDELYVRLAELRQIPLLTFDAQMRVAAKQRGVALLPN